MQKKQRVGQYQGDIDPVELSDYDLVYFGRCINYTDSEYLDLEWLRARTAELSKHAIVAFAQIEQPPEKARTYEFQQHFVQVFSGIARKCILPWALCKESLYLMGGNPWQ